MNITMKDVAKEAGVSLGTVSNYINGKSSIKQMNKDRIEEAIHKLGYEVNEVARNLKLKSSRTMGVIIPSFGNVFAVKTISYLERYFKEENYDLYVSSYDTSQEGMEEQIVSLVGKKVDGLIIMPSVSLREKEIEKINTVIDKGIPVVVFDCSGDEVRCDHVVLNNYSVFEESTKYLLGLGHESIAFVLGPQDIYSTEERLHGFKAAYDAFGLTVDEELILYTDYSKRDTKDKVKGLLDKRRDITVTMTAGYRMTLGVLAACKEEQVAVPKELSILGFDMDDIANILPYGLAGINIPVKEVARQIVQLVMKRIDSGFQALPMTSEVELKFVKGDSVLKVKE